MIPILLLVLLPQSTVLGQTSVWRSSAGSIYFKSDAPLELIDARSNDLQGVIKPSDGSYAFTVDISTFQGFNSTLQREHFNENYLESHQYPKATFTGRMIEKIDFSQNGNYVVRAKGMLTIHGVEHERIIKSSLSIKDGVLQLVSNFTVPLADHRISIPHIVYQKIAEEISVEVKATFQLKTIGS